MKNKGYKAVISVVIASLIFGGLVLAAVGRHGRGGRLGAGFGPPLLSSDRKTQGPGLYGMGEFGVPMGYGRPEIFGRPYGLGRDMMLLGILHRLDLTDEQIEKIKDIRKANKDKIEAATKAIDEAAKALHEAVLGADEAAIRAAGTKLGNAVGEQAVLRATTITSIKKVLTDEQLTKLEEFQKKMKDRAGKFREAIGCPAFHERLRHRGAAGWMGRPHWGGGRGPQPMGRPDFERPFGGMEYRRGWEPDRGIAPGWEWQEQGPPLRR